MRRIWVVFGVLVALVASMLGAAVPASADVIDVMPGESIQDAIDAAHAGDTIVVHPGVYHENLLVNKDRIKLRGSGASADGTVLLPPADPKGPGKGDGIAVLGDVDFKTGAVHRRSHGVQVSGFLVKGFKEFGIFAYATDGFEFSHNMAVNNGEYGISGFNIRDGRFVNNVAVGSGEAGYYWGDSKGANAVIRGNEAYGNRLGIFVRDSSQGVVQDNHVHDNCTGLLVLDTASDIPVVGWRVTGNQAWHNNRFCAGDGGDAGRGIVVAGARRTTIASNTIWDNHTSHKVQFPGGLIIVSGKKIAGGADPARVRVRSNQVFKNRAHDIIWDGSGSRITFKGNQCDTSDPGGLCH
jgi:parallel beta-helix repeat protein